MVALHGERKSLENNDTVESRNAHNHDDINDEESDSKPNSKPDKIDCHINSSEKEMKKEKSMSRFLVTIHGGRKSQESNSIVESTNAHEPNGINN